MCDVKISFARTNTLGRILTTTPALALSLELTTATDLALVPRLSTSLAAFTRGL